MKALVIEQPNVAVVKEVPYPHPGSNDVTIKVENVGICGTDVHIFKGEFISPYPIVPGHEFSGVIHEIGENVTNFQVGDRVTADPSLFCGECQYCLTNRGNQCENWGALGNTLNGSMAEYVSVPSKNVVKIPDSLSFEAAAFIEPMACVVHGMNRLQLQVGDRVVLFGAGAMGQQLVQSLKMAGASELIVVDISEKKLEMAISRGASRGVLSQDLASLKEEYPNGFDVVVDATGIPAVIEQALEFMGPTAKYLQFGVTAEDAQISLSPFKLYNKDWTIIGSMAINHTFLPAYQWLKEERIEVESLVSKTLTLEETVEFFNSNRDPDLLKVQIKL
ncbi:zinc-dependent alcohol dehydrogenase family protein [Bacillus sp. FJAT-50079]|uniref:zinc-dependent alcohol dehydrogenase family protein n=1 Tax=Bacillus sp. FJAT-50079 TaxID=2833577 RepID=UPI001BC973A7|nr:zinc-dependent alcohol dehydrogenase family protein [Bacillus sp. FJAT-50079]MBS4206869.1 zinc-dependent alcohol dehydrogenase family protein [Bacillus sp. FJAT-50079]